MTELYLVRHGQTEENAAHILQGHMPGHLSHEGIAQAQALRDKLKNIRFDALLCSDLRRCMDTAMILNEPHGLPLESTPLLRERDWGPFTGMDILKARTKIDHRAEPVESMFRRAETFLLDIVSRYKDKRVLVVSHGLFCRVIQAACSGKTIRDIPRMDNAEVRHLILTPLLLPARRNRCHGQLKFYSSTLEIIRAQKGISVTYFLKSRPSFILYKSLASTPSIELSYT